MFAYKKKMDVKVPGLKMVKPPALNMSVKVTLDKKIAKEAEKDPLLIQEFSNACLEIYEQTNDTIRKKCVVFDKVFLTMVEKGADQKVMDKQLSGLNNAIKNDVKIAEKACELAVKAAWKDLQSKRKEWKNFKIKIVSTIGATLAGLAVSIAATVTSPFSGGAGAVIGIAGFIKSAATLVTEVGKIAITIEQSKVVLETNLAVVEKAAKNSGVFAANEISAAVLNEFVGISQPSIKTCDSAMSTLSAKYAQIVVKVHDVSRKLNKVLKDQDKMRKDFLKDVDKRLKGHPTPSPKAVKKIIEKQLDDALAKSYTEVQALIDKIPLMYNDVVKWKKPIENLSKRMKKLELKDSKGLKVLREILKLAGVGLAVIDGNKIAKGAQDLGMGLGAAAASYTYDKIFSKAVDGTIFDAA